MAESSTADSKKQTRSKFHPLFWLVIVFEFFERGSYYGVMSVLAVYMTDHLKFSKTDFGLIQSTITPLLYFLPIISGALADRFGYRRTLMVAFSLLGTGYFLTSQATSYAAVFICLVVMGIGAGTFKPVISGSIARCTDETNSTLGFGIFYWTINLGAFLVPLFLVPFLKNNIGWNWVLIAAAIGTGSMLLPTLFLFKEPPKPKGATETIGAKKPSLLQTLANAFEIIYSPVVLANRWAHNSKPVAVILTALLMAPLGAGAYLYSQPGQDKHTLTAARTTVDRVELQVNVKRDLLKKSPYKIAADKKTLAVKVTLNNPDKFAAYEAALLQELRAKPGLKSLTPNTLRDLKQKAVKRTTLLVIVDQSQSAAFTLKRSGADRFELTVQSKALFAAHALAIRKELDTHPELATLGGPKLEALVFKAGSRSFGMLFVGILLLGAVIIIRFAAPRFKAAAGLGARLGYMLLVMGPVWGTIWLLPHLSLFMCILSTAISLTLLALYEIGTEEVTRFKDHARFLLMIVLYSGFWVLYFQMFGAALWYMQSYVDAGSLNSAVNGVAATFGFKTSWYFDVEHVTVINAGTIIALQLLISSLVKNTKAMSTLIVGISLATIGMIILALSASIWVFIIGIMIFSIGEMTAHPKFIAYVGQIAPKSKVAMYMGYLFLYGVIGAGIGGVLGANLYVKYVDEQNQPRTLWLILAGIGVATIVMLLLYNKFIAKPDPAANENAA